jgi:hypothetical protein
MKEERQAYHWDMGDVLVTSRQRADQSVDEGEVKAGRSAEPPVSPSLGIGWGCHVVLDASRDIRRAYKG